MAWTKSEHEVNYFNQPQRTMMNCGVYKEHLIILGHSFTSQNDVLCCWDASILPFPDLFVLDSS